jgi:hypothetical protein
VAHCPVGGSPFRPAAEPPCPAGKGRFPHGMPRRGASVGACQAGMSGALDVAVAAVASQLPRAAPTGTGQLGTVPIRLPAAAAAATSSQRGAS